MTNIKLKFILVGVSLLYIKRIIEKTIKKTSDTFRVLLVTGPRQVGKTTVLRQVSEPNRTYVSLDDPMIRELAVNDPVLFLQRYKPPLLIDEIQYAPQLLPYIKINVDNSGKNGEYWLTGSQMFHLMRNVSESLAGRVGIIPLLGLSYNEIYLQNNGAAFIPDKDVLLSKAETKGSVQLNETFNLIFKGSMPALYAGTNIEREMFFSSYIGTYLQRDVRDLTQVGDELAFLRFLSSVAARTAQEVNYADLAKDTGISAPTAKQWMSILVTSGIVHLIQPYFNNALKRMIKSPKMYFLDTGLCAYLTKWASPETLETGAMSGAIFETWVVSEIIKSYYNVGRQAPLYYYRDKEQREIDLIIERDNRLHPIEIKKSGSPNKDAIRHFSALNKLGMELGMGGVICLSENLLPIDKDNWIIPVSLI
ncbi:MAG: ATP-binding protein [Peptococcaceae bacterium]|nr:ATP-binding protein [Peptococcaceae bacterium]